MALAATGTLVDLTVLLDQPQKDSNGVFIDSIGQPLPDLKVLATPSAPSAATGSSGAVTSATRYYKIDEQTKSMKRSAASAATSSIALAAEKGALTSIPKPTDTRVMWTNIYASDDGTKYGWIGTIDHYRAEGESTTGTGLEDATFTGTYTGVGRDALFEIEVTATGTPDTFRWRKNGGSWTSGVTITGGAQTLSDGISVTFAATTGHTLTSSGGRTWFFSTWTTAFSDNVATPDYSNRPISTSEVGANYGLRGLSPKSVTAYPNQQSAESSELNGYVGPARSFPTLKSFEFSKEFAMRPGVNALMGIAQLGQPDSITAIDGTRVFKTVTSPSTARSKPQSFTPQVWEGSPSIRPEMLPGTLVENRVFTFAADAGEGFVVNLATTLKGTRHSLVGFGTEGTAGAYADQYAPVIVGVLRSGITSIAVNVTTAPSGGTFKIKCAVNGAGYGSPETTVYYDTGAGNIQIAGGSQASPYVELFDESGLALGGDSGENREPVLIYFPGPCSTLSLNDDWTWTANGILIPGSGSSPYSGSVITREREWRISAPHFQLLRAAQGQTPSTLVKVISGSLTIENPLGDGVRELDQEAKTPKSYDRTELTRWKLELVGRYYSRYLQEIVHRDERIALTLNLLGELIPNAPGSLSAYRRGTVWSVPQAAVRGTPTRPIGGRSVIMENFTIEAEKSDVDGEDVFTETTYSDRLWLPPGMSLTNATA